MKAMRLENREGMIAESAIGIVERDDDLALGDGARALHDLSELLERQGAIARTREPFDLTREAPR